MSGYLGLDIGDKRIGIAYSVSGVLATGVETYVRKSIAADAAYLRQMADRLQVQTVVSGLPRHLNGDAHQQAEKNEILLEAIRRTGLAVEYWDERLSSAAAERVMLEADLSRKKRKQNIDKLAAVIILQNYLDYQNQGGNSQ